MLWVFARVAGPIPSKSAPRADFKEKESSKNFLPV
jgi:hypothetical protein